jgi:hypothetical protein
MIESEHIWNDIDPTIFIDDDGQAYLFWGNPALFYVKLNKDMISYEHSVGQNGVVSVPMDTVAFGSSIRPDGKPGTKYVEGPWFYKRNGIYYMVYAAAGIPEYIAYSTAPAPGGPWTYKGFVMERAPKLAFTNHSGIVDYKGKSYFFYHSESMTGGGGFRRSVCLEQFKYNADGSIPLIVPSPEGVKESVSALNPYKQTEAETIGWSEGLKTASADNKAVYVTKISNGDYIKVNSVDFGKGATTFEAGVASVAKGGQIEIRLNSADGELLGTLEVNNTSGMDKWAVQSCKVKPVSGIHDLYFVFKGGEGDLFNFDWWKFTK